MQWTVPELSQNAFVPVIVAGVVVALVGITNLSKRPNLDAIPSVGPNNWLGSWWTALRFLINSDKVTMEGYRKYKGTLFKIPTINRWVVIVSNHKHIEEVRSARDDELLYLEPIFEDMNIEYTMGPEVHHNPHLIAGALSQLTRSLGEMFPDLQDEIVTSFEETLDLKNNEWKSVPAVDVIQKVVCRVSNRAFVGLPVCRNHDFVELCLQYTVHVVTGALIVGMFPQFLKPKAAWLMTSVPKSIRQGIKHLRSVIEERAKCMREYGDKWTEKPMDLLSWVMDVTGPDAPVKLLTHYIMSTNFAAVSTSSEVFGNALLNLAANPQCVQPLREEVEDIVAKEGWSKASVGKMHKVDSFLRESARMDSISVWGLTRKTNVDFTLSDGTLIPKGSRINACIRAIHYDDELYENAEGFNAFRYVNLASQGKGGGKYQFVTTAPDYLAFGHGRHACPGRWFAAVELKTMLAHVVTSYDVKLADNAKRPQNMLVGEYVIAHPTAKVMFRKTAGNSSLDAVVTPSRQ